MRFTTWSRACAWTCGFSYESIDDLVPYCRRVAGSVGRLSLAVFRVGEGPANEALDSLADDLGVALQLTNIIRDIREDYGNRRVYLPADDLARFGVETRELVGRRRHEPSRWSASRQRAPISGSTAGCA